MVFTHFRKGQGIIAVSLCPNGQACHGGCVLGPRCRCKQVTVVCGSMRHPFLTHSCGRSPKKRGLCRSCLSVKMVLNQIGLSAVLMNAFKFWYKYRLIVRLITAVTGRLSRRFSSRSQVASYMWPSREQESLIHIYWCISPPLLSNMSHFHFWSF